MIRVDDEIELIPIHAGFAEAIAEHVDRDRERLARWMPWADGSRTADDARAYVATVEERRALDLGECYAIVVNEEFAGAVDVHDVNRQHAIAALGYWLGSIFYGRGIMTRAVRAAADRAFTRHRVHRLELYAAVENRPSRAVAERAGFTLEAILRSRLRAPDGFEDAALYVRFAP
ncbi:MAG TPA: GNAT family N-acetyltransferase [Candidatus Elarobacter sp.]|nr:GNAT family N-acetyltransferase [Candidatus Elarobacter sp.]